MKLFSSGRWPGRQAVRSGILPGLASKVSYGKLAGMATLFFLVAGLVLVPFSPAHQSDISSQPASSNRSLSEEEAGQAYGQLPLSFEANQGQANEQVRFQSQGSGYRFYLTAREMVINLSQPTPVDKTAGFDLKKSSPVQKDTAQAQPQTTNLRMKWLGGNPDPVVSGAEKQEGITNYLLGNDASKWRTNIPNYGKVDYQEVYPGIDLTFYGNHGQLEYDFVLKPQTSPEPIRLSFEGASSLELNQAGDLVVHTAGGDIVQPAPRLYEEVNGVRQPVKGSFKLLPQDGQPSVVGFEVGEYDASHKLVIDPTLIYSTFLGGSSNDYGNSIAVDSSGNTFLTGYTRSTNFPTLNAYQSAFGGSLYDTYVTKLNSTGGLVYSTYLGGNSIEYGYAIAIDSSDNAIVTGETLSTNFPVQNAYQSTPGGDFDGFITKLNSTGGLVYSTYLGGTLNDCGFGISVDNNGNVLVAGSTYSDNFPRQNAYQNTFGGGTTDAFVTKLTSAGALAYSTYLGGSDSDTFEAARFDSSGNALVTGYTRSTDFPTLNPYQSTYSGIGNDGFVAKLNSAGSVVYATYLGGNGDDAGYSIAVDNGGNAFVTGVTSSTNFPNLNAYQTTYAGNSDAYLVKLSSAGSLVFSTYLGGSNTDYGRGVTVDGNGNILVAGSTSATNFPTLNAYQNISGGGYDAFLTKLNSTGSLLFSTYLGSTDNDYGNGVAVDSDGIVYVIGDTFSATFPILNAYQSTFGGVSDAYIVKINTQTLKTCVVNSTSDNAATAGGFRNALTQSPQCDIINFSFASATTIAVTGSPLPSVPVGVTINGVCSGDLPIVTISGTGVTGTGLFLSGGDTVNCLKIQGFNGVQLKAMGGSGKNILLHVKASKT